MLYLSLDVDNNLHYRWTLTCTCVVRACVRTGMRACMRLGVRTCVRACLRAEGALRTPYGALRKYGCRRTRCGERLWHALSLYTVYTSALHIIKYNHLEIYLRTCKWTWTFYHQQWKLVAEYHAVLKTDDHSIQYAHTTWRFCSRSFCNFLIKFVWSIESINPQFYFSV